MALANVDSYVVPSSTVLQQEHALDAMSLQLEQGQISIQAVLLHMDSYLTTADDLIRSRGVKFLAELLARVELPTGTVHLMAEFFIRRLADTACLDGALSGCLALLRGGQVSQRNVLDLLEVISAPLDVPALPQKYRAMTLQALDCILEQHLFSMSDISALFDAIRASFEDEKDPRCLLVAFGLVKRASELLPNASSPISEAQLFFDCLCRYFPISFKPIPGACETQEDLIGALQSAFASTPLFAAECVPFLLDKLSSSLQSAKLQSLSALGFCLQAYGANAVASYAEPIWKGLKSELFQEATDTKVFTAATKCLSQCIRAFQSADDSPYSDGGQLLHIVLQDAVISDMFSRDDHHICTAGHVLTAAARSSRSCSAVIAQQVLRVIMDQLASSMNPVLVEALSSILCGTRDLAKEHALKCLHEGSKYDTKWLDAVYSSREELVNIFSQGVSTSQTLCTASREQLSRASVTGLASLATYPGYLSSLPKLEARNLVSTLMNIISGVIEDGMDMEPAVGAVTSICETEETFISLGHSGVVTETVVPMLLQLLYSNEKNEDRRIPALATVAKSAGAVRDLLLDGVLQEFSISPQSDKGSLQCLSALLPLYSNDDESRRPMLVACKIWSSVEVLPNGREGIPLSEQVVKLLMETLRVSVSKCNQTEQEIILRKAVDAYSHHTEVKWLGALVSSVAVSSRPNSILQSMETIDLLYDVAMSWESDEVIAEALAEALASVLNKWSVTQPSLDSVIDHVVGKAEPVALRHSDGSLSVQAVHILIWMAKALAMRGHTNASNISRLLLRLPMAGIDADVLRVAAKGFGVIVEDARVLNKDYYAIEQPIYKQKFFVGVLGPMLEALKAEAAGASRTWLIRGFCYLVVSVPYPALLSEAAAVFPLMVSVLSALACDPQDAEILKATLLVVSSFLLTENQRDLVGRHASTLLNQLMELTRYPHSWVVRQTALQCLGAAVGLPYASIYPFKHQILTALSQALDDKRRAVRREAAHCYQAWLFA